MRSRIPAYINPSRRAIHGAKSWLLLGSKRWDEFKLRKFQSLTRTGGARRSAGQQSHNKVTLLRARSATFPSMANRRTS